MTPGAATANARTDNTNNCNNTRRTNKEMLWLVRTRLAPIGTYTSVYRTPRPHRQTYKLEHDDEDVFYVFAISKWSRQLVSLIYSWLYRQMICN